MIIIFVIIINFLLLVSNHILVSSHSYDYWTQKIELTKTSITSKKEIIHPNVDVGFLAFLVGIIDGDGYIQMRKKLNGYIEYNLVITFNNRDLATFEYILSKLHFGVIAKINTTTSKLVLYNFELKYVLVPLLLKHGLYFLTKNRIDQYNRLLYTIEHNIKKWDKLPESVPNYSPFNFNNSKDILNSVWYFKTWLVGFVVAEGSFFEQANKEICFSISQKGNRILMDVIHFMFKTSRAMYYSKEKDIHILRMSSNKDVQQVVNFFSFENNYPLIGYKKDQYKVWLKALKESIRYKNLKLP